MYLASVGCAKEAADVSAAYRQLGTLTLEVTIGAEDGEPEYLFSSIMDVLPAQDGTVWVLDGTILARTIRQFDSEGIFLREVGRRGGGPGEFGLPSALAQLTDGRVVLRDASRPDHLLVYHADGSPDTTWVFNPPIDGSTNPRHALLADRNGLLWVLQTGGGLVRVNGRWESARGTHRYYRLRSNGAILDTVLVPQLPKLPLDGVGASGRLPSGGRFSQGIQIPYQPWYTWGWSPEGYFVTGRTDNYRIDFWNAPSADEERLDASRWTAGEPVKVIRRQVPPVRVSKEERSDLRKQIRQQLAQLPGDPSGPVPEIARIKPYFRMIFFGQDGRMWVWVHIPSERITPASFESEEGTLTPDWHEPLAFDVFESDGTFLGRVVLPSEAYPYPNFVRTRGDWVWCVIVEESGAQVVHRYRITWP